MGDIFRQRVIRLPHESLREKREREHTRHALFHIVALGPMSPLAKTPEHRKPEVGHGHGIGEGNEPHPHVRMGQHADVHVQEKHKTGGGGYIP